MVRPTKPEYKLTEAADKATALLQGLQLRLNSQLAERPVESPDDLDRQLREYFMSSAASFGTSVMDQLRERVVDAVADRILESWEQEGRGELGALENQVIGRVAERILERMTKR